jgi:hypothetical protein
VRFGAGLLAAAHPERGWFFPGYRRGHSQPTGGRLGAQATGGSLAKVQEASDERIKQRLVISMYVFDGMD